METCKLILQTANLGLTAFYETPKSINFQRKRTFKVCLVTILNDINLANIFYFQKRDLELVSKFLNSSENQPNFFNLLICGSGDIMKNWHFLVSQYFSEIINF